MRSHLNVQMGVPMFTAFEPNTLIARLCLWEQAGWVLASLCNKYQNSWGSGVCLRQHTGGAFLQTQLIGETEPLNPKKIGEKERETQLHVINAPGLTWLLEEAVRTKVKCKLGHGYMGTWCPGPSSKTPRALASVAQRIERRIKGFRV